MLKIGFMDYANVYPIFYYLLQDKNIEYIKGVPSELNKAMRQGLIDVSPASSIEFARNHDLYNVHNKICVSSIGAVKSVNLYSNYKAEELKGKKIYFTKDSNTSTVLCRIVLEKFYNVKPIYVDDENNADASLLIGDKALFAYYNSSAPYIIDLGKEWYNFTKLPFVFALWIIKKSAEKDEYYHTLIENITKYGMLFPKDIENLAPKYLEKGYTLEQIEDYWNTIVYEMTDEHKKGLSLFYNLAYELGETKDNGADYIDNAFIKKVL